MSVETKQLAGNLMDLALRSNRGDLYFDQIRRLNDLLNADGELRKYIDDESIPSEAKKARLKELLGGRADDEVLNNLFAINPTGANSTVELIREFLKRVYKANGQTMGTIYSYRQLSRPVIQKLEKAMSAKVGYSVRFENRIDDNIVGGVRVVIGKNEWDGTYNARIQMLKDELDDYHTSFTSSEDIRKDIENKLTSLKTLKSIRVKNEDNTGVIKSVADGIIRIIGMKDAMAGELLQSGDAYAMVMNLEDDNIGAVLLGSEDDVVEGSEIYTTGRIIEVPVGDVMLGRVVDSLGNAIDGLGRIRTDEYYPIERKAPGVIERQSVSEPLETGLKVIDSMIPIGKGQRELIIGDRQTGKTAIAIDTILNQKGKDVKCIYVAIGQKSSTVAKLVEKLRENGAMEYTTVVVSNASDMPILQYIAPYAGCAIGEYWMERGEDVLIVYDDLSKHAVAYRTLSLLLRRPPGREAYPGDVFYLHSRLLERSARLSDEKGGGSLTALPIVETLAGDISAYIPTNVISITDGQIFLQTELFNSGFRPAVDSGLSVSRVGSAAQCKAMKKVSSALKLELAQYQEVLDFAQFGSDVDPVTKMTINHGERLMALLKQPQYSPLPIERQIVILLAAQNRFLEDIAVRNIPDYENRLYHELTSRYRMLMIELEQKQVLGPELESKLLKVIEEFTGRYRASLLGK